MAMGLLRGLRGGSGALLAAMMMGMASGSGLGDRPKFTTYNQSEAGTRPSRAKRNMRRGMFRTRAGGWMMKQGVKKARNQKGRKLIFH